MTCWKTNKAEAAWEINQRVSGGMTGHEDRQRWDDPGDRMSIQSQKPGYGPRWGVHTMWPSLSRNLVISSHHHLGKREPRGEGQPSVPQKALNNIFQSEMEASELDVRKSLRQKIWLTSNSTGVMSFTGSFLEDIIGFHQGSHLSGLELIST